MASSPLSEALDQLDQALDAFFQAAIEASHIQVALDFLIDQLGSDEKEAD
jgi:hypothetical protein